MELQNELSRFALEQEVSELQRQQAAVRVVDGIAAGIDAWQGEFMATVREQFDPRGGRRNAGYHTGGDPERTAFLNGIAIHAEDFDDTHRKAGVHATAVVVPTLLALSEGSETPVSHLLDSAAIGLEVAIRLGIDVGPELNTRGFHSTSMLAHFGAIAGAGRLTKMDQAALANALALATSMTSGIHQYRQGGGSAKRLHAGLAARSSLTAIQLAQAGVAGGSNAFETKDGFYSNFADRAPRPEVIFGELGTQWHFNDIRAKRWPVCHHAQSAIDAALELRPSIHGREIDTVIVYVTEDAVRTICEPRESKLRPTTYGVKFSIYVLVAMALVYGDVEISRDRVESAEVIELAERISYLTMPVRASSGTYPGGLEVHYKTGTPDRRLLENPILMQASDVVAKATSVSSRAGLSPKWIDRIIDGDGTVQALLQELSPDA